MNNPYTPPSATLHEFGAEEQTYTPSLLSSRGRIGRWRYLAYIWLMATLLVFLLRTITLALIPGEFQLQGQPRVMIVFIALLYALPFIVVNVIYARRRFHDLDINGWFSLLVLIPGINVCAWLYLVFAPGNSGPNKYGPAPGPNSILFISSALFIPTAFICFMVLVFVLVNQNPRQNIGHTQQR